jgi:hypothetical protein
MTERMRRDDEEILEDRPAKMVRPTRLTSGSCPRVLSTPSLRSVPKNTILAFLSNTYGVLHLVSERSRNKKGHLTVAFCISRMVQVKQNQQNFCIL